MIGSMAKTMLKDESFMVPPAPLVAAVGSGSDGLTTIDGDLLTTTPIVLYVRLRFV